MHRGYRLRIVAVGCVAAIAAVVLAGKAQAVTRSCYGEVDLVAETLVGSTWLPARLTAPDLARASASGVRAKSAREAACATAAGKARALVRSRYSVEQIAGLICADARRRYRDRAANAGRRIRRIQLVGRSGSGMGEPVMLRMAAMSCPRDVAAPDPGRAKAVLCIDYTKLSMKLERDMTVLGLPHPDTTAAGQYAWCLYRPLSAVQRRHDRRVDTVSKAVAALDDDVRRVAGASRRALCPVYGRIGASLHQLSLVRAYSRAPLRTRGELERWCLARSTRAVLHSRDIRAFRRTGYGYYMLRHYARLPHRKTLGYYPPAPADLVACARNDRPFACGIFARYRRCTSDRRRLYGKSCLGARD